MQMIADGKIKEGTVIKIEDKCFEYMDGDFFSKEVCQYLYNYFDYSLRGLISENFEILEDTTEEIEECVIRHYNTPVEKEKYIEEKMNEIIKAVNIIKKTFTVDTSKETNCMSE